MEWLEDNWLPLSIVILVILGFIGWIISLCKSRGLRQVALDAILEVEKAFGSGKGKEKMQCAVDYVFDLLPIYIKVILPKDFLKSSLEKFIQKLFDDVKELLDYQKVENLKEGGK